MCYSCTHITSMLINISYNIFANFFVWYDHQNQTCPLNCCLKDCSTVFAGIPATERQCTAPLKSWPATWCRCCSAFFARHLTNSMTWHDLYIFLPFNIYGKWRGFTPSSTFAELTQLVHRAWINIQHLHNHMYARVVTCVNIHIDYTVH